MKLDRNQINIFNFYINILINLVFVIEKVNYLDIFDFLKDFIYTFVSLYLKR